MLHDIVHGQRLWATSSEAHGAAPAKPGVMHQSELGTERKKLHQRYYHDGRNCMNYGRADQAIAEIRGTRTRSNISVKGASTTGTDHPYVYFSLPRLLGDSVPHGTLGSEKCNRYTGHMGGK